MSGIRALEYLRQICGDIDEGRIGASQGLRKALWPVALPLAIGAASLAGTGCSAPQTTGQQELQGGGTTVSDGGLDPAGDTETEIVEVDAEPQEASLEVVDPIDVEQLQYPPYAAPFETTPA